MTRSALMNRIRSRGNASTKLAMAALFRRYGVAGWRRHIKVLGIRPDFVFKKTKIAVFIDGCFWHACFSHCHAERLQYYWRTKVVNNWVRDIEQNKLLKSNGWHVIRVWEHDLRKGRENVDMQSFK